MPNLPIYGLTQDTMNLYRSMVNCGYSYESAMKNLKEIYQANKQFATELPISVIYPKFATVH